MTEGTIRDADPGRDAAGCLAVYAPFVAETVVSFEEVVPTVEEFAARMRRIQTAYPWLVLDADGAVAGYAYGSAHSDRAAYRWSADVAVYVGEGFRGRGAGRRLYEALFERLRAQNLQVLCAGVALPNDASVGLHRALGFRPVGVYHRIGWKLGAWRDVEWFELELAPASGGPPPEPLPPR